MRHTGAILLTEIEINAPTVYSETSVHCVGMYERGITVEGF